MFFSLIFGNVGYLEKYKGKGLLKKWQRRYCVLTPLALYYYENQKDRKQKGQILLPSSGSTICKGCDNYPEIKDKKLCFELFNNDRIFLVGSFTESCGFYCLPLSTRELCSTYEMN